jgi:phosphotransferase system enzyme I (PtsI)
MSARREIDAVTAAKGMALGRARLIYPLHFEVETGRIAARAIAAELQRLDHALAAARDELGGVRSRLRRGPQREVVELIDMHLAMLADPEFRAGVAALIRGERLPATAALKTHRDQLARVFESIDDPYLRSRGEDLDHVVARVYSALRREGAPAPAIHAAAGTVLVCETIMPADLDQAVEQGVVAVVLTAGSPYSHAAILARGLNLPLVCGAAGALAQIREGDEVLVDAHIGRVIVAPDALDLRGLRARERDAAQARRRSARMRSTDTRTRDGAAVRLYVNAEQPGDIASARRDGAAGVGLYRSEFVFLRHTAAPDEEQQFRAYRDAVSAMAGKPVTLRTLDLGSDKARACGVDVGAEENPALGVRGVRLTLAHEQLFYTQLRAMLRASAYGPVRILLPMLVALDEVRRTRALLDLAREELMRERIPFDTNVPLGGMIEVPGAALMAGEFARALDFLAIGSNDLTQYTLAADRNNGGVRTVYEPLHPAVVRLIAHIATAAKRARRSVMVCGELAGEARGLPVLLALGMTEFSVHPRALLDARQTLTQLSRRQLLARRARLLRAGTPEEVLRAVDVASDSATPSA